VQCIAVCAAMAEARSMQIMSYVGVVAMWCSVMQRVAVCRSVLQVIRVWHGSNVCMEKKKNEKPFFFVGCIPHQKLLGGGFSTRVNLFCLMCTINLNKTGNLN